MKTLGIQNLLCRGRFSALDPNGPGTAPAARVAFLPSRAMRGYTLIETMMVVLITSIFGVAASPSFIDFIAGQRVKTAAFDLFSDLVFARSEAIKTNSEVIVAKAAGGWSNGWVVTWVDKGGVTRTLRSHVTSPGLVALTGSLDQVGYQRNGRPLVGTSTAKFTLDDAGGKAVVAARCIQVDPSGRPNSLTGACT